MNDTTATPNTKDVAFNFRVLKADHKDFADTEAEYTEKGIAFSKVMDKTDKEKLIGIKRDSVSYALPIIAASSFSAEFVNGLIMDQVSDVVKKEFIDNNLEPDLSVLTPAYIEEALAAKRTAAIDPEAVEALAVVTSEFLTENGVPDPTVRIVVELVKGKFTKRVLKGYITLKDQFEMALGNVEKAMNAQEAELKSLLEPVHAQLAANLARFIKDSANDETPLELALM